MLAEDIQQCLTFNRRNDPSILILLIILINIYQHTLALISNKLKYGSLRLIIML